MYVFLGQDFASLEALGGDGRTVNLPPPQELHVVLHVSQKPIQLIGSAPSYMDAISKA